MTCFITKCSLRMYLWVFYTDDKGNILIINLNVSADVKSVALP